MRLLQQAPLSELSMNAKKDMKGAIAFKKEDDKRKENGVQLEPKNFTEFMANVGGVEDTELPMRFHRFDERQVPVNIEKLVERAIEDMDRNKAIRVDGIHVESLQVNGPATVCTLTHLWKTIGRTGKIPRNWLQGIFIPVHKKGKQD